MRYLTLQEISDQTGELPDTIYRRARRAGIIVYNEQGKVTVPINFALPDEIIERMYFSLDVDQVPEIIHKWATMPDDAPMFQDLQDNYGLVVSGYRKVRIREVGGAGISDFKGYHVRDEGNDQTY
jgi:hypothetical protein